MTANRKARASQYRGSVTVEKQKETSQCRTSESEWDKSANDVPQITIAMTMAPSQTLTMKLQSRAEQSYSYLGISVGVWQWG